MSNLPLWGCLNRIRVLQEFNQQVETYLNDSQESQYSEYRKTRSKHVNTKKVREQINRMLPKASRFLREAGTYPIITVREPPFVGGRIWNIDVAENIFNLENWELSPQAITDSVQRAIGYYQDDLLNSFFRTINPFWWLMRLIAALIRIPFGILAWAGYDAGKFEESSPGKLYKAVAGFVVFVGFLASVAQILDSLGLIQPLRDVVQQMLK